MKTAHECLDLFDLKQLTNYDKWIKVIELVQLDAYKAGMTEAAEIANNKLSDSTGQEIAKDILSARDRKESL